MRQSRPYFLRRDMLRMFVGANMAWGLLDNAICTGEIFFAPNQSRDIGAKDVSPLQPFLKLHAVTTTDIWVFGANISEDT